VKLFVLKPDEIGDFVLSLGALHLLATHFGPDDVALAVKAPTAALARREFPQAEVFPLTLERRMVGEATGFRNFANAWPWLRRWLGEKTEVATCWRARRTFLHSLLFVAPRARRRAAVTNPSDPKIGRFITEWLLRWIFRTDLAPYPEVQAGRPTELEAHRRLASVLLGREVAWEEILPRFRDLAWRGGGGFWMLCPLSSRTQKDYPAKRWAAALREVAPQVPAGGVQLAGGPDQRELLEDFAAALREGGCGCPVSVREAVGLENFAGEMASADLVLTVDTSAAHFSTALRAPAVVVSSGLHAGVYGPYTTDGRQHWLVGDWAGRGAKGWADSVAPSAIAEAIRRLAAAPVTS